MVDRNAIAAAAINLLRDRICVEVEVIQEDMRLVEDLGLDSLGRIELGISAEDVFGIEIPDEALKGVETVKDVIELIVTTLKAA